jgi:hypothetical protein
MSTDSSKFRNISGPIAVAVAAHIDGPASNADILCRSGLPYPTAVEIARQMKAGVGNAKKLFESCQFSISDAAALASAITAAGVK